MAMPKGNTASSSGAAGAQEEDYDEVPTASAAWSEGHPGAPEITPAPTPPTAPDPGTSQTLPSGAPGQAPAAPLSPITRVSLITEDPGLGGCRR